MSIMDRIRPDLREFIPYASARRVGLDARIRLDANESPWSQDGLPALNRYPSPQPTALVDALSALYDVDASRLWIGRGSDEAIDLLVRAFCRSGVDNIASITPTFGMYGVAARLQGAGFRGVPLAAKDDFALDPQRLLDATDDDTKIVVLCSPNNPTGTLHHESIAWLAERLSGRSLLLVDEAYIEFSDHASATSMLDRFDNLAVLRTLSKAHALAGARVGALLANASLVRLVGSIAAPYPLPSPSTDAALAALGGGALAMTRDRIATIKSERERLRVALMRADGIEAVFASQANFLLIRVDDAAHRFGSLLDAGVLVRDVSAQPSLGNCLRMGIGRPDENDVLLAAFGVALPDRMPDEVAA